MADEYDFNDDVTLSADPDHGASDFNDLKSSKRGGNSKRPMILGLALLVVLGAAGAYFYYTMFLSEPEMPVAPIRPIAVAPTNSMNAQANKLPQPTMAGMPSSPGMTPPPALGTIPPVPGAPTMSGMPPAAAPGVQTLTPVGPNGATAVATTASKPGMPPALPKPVVPGNTSITPAAPVTSTTSGSAAIPALNSALATNTASNLKPADTKPATSVAAATAATAPKTVEKTAADTTTVAASKPVMPVPPAQQLKPIDPDEAQVNKNYDMDTKPAAVLHQVKTDAQKKTAETMAAVNDILNSALPESTGNKTVDDTLAKASGGKRHAGANMPVANAAPPPPVEVTSRAEQVIKVKKVFSSQSPQALNAAGDRVLDNGQYESAVQIFDKQLSANPSDTVALAGKAQALQKAGRDAEAMDAYKRLIDLNSRDVEALTNYLGLLQKQQPEQAMTRLNALSDQYPDNAAVAGQIAAVFATQMDTPNALRYFMKASALDNKNATYPFNIAVLYDRLGNSQKAGQYYQSALSLAQSYPEYGVNLPVDTIRNRLRGMDSN